MTNKHNRFKEIHVRASAEIISAIERVNQKHVFCHKEDTHVF